MDFIFNHPKLLNKEHLGNWFVSSETFHQKQNWGYVQSFAFLISVSFGKPTNQS